MLALRRRFQEAQAEALRLEAQAQALRSQAESLRAELASQNLHQLLKKQADLESELKAVRSSLARLAHTPRPQAPEPVEPPQPGPLQREREALGARLAQSRELAARWQRYREDQARYAAAQQDIADLEARLRNLHNEQSELRQKLFDLQSRKAELEQAQKSLHLQHLEGALQAARGRTRALAEEETRLVARTNALLSDLEALHLTQARREASIETPEQELSLLPPGPTEAGSSRSLARALAETEAALEALGPINHLAEQEYALLGQDIARLEQALEESEAVVRKLEGELHLVDSAYKARMQQVYRVFSKWGLGRESPTKLGFGRGGIAPGRR